MVILRQEILPHSVSFKLMTCEHRGKRPTSLWLSLAWKVVIENRSFKKALLSRQSPTVSHLLAHLEIEK